MTKAPYKRLLKIKSVPVIIRVHLYIYIYIDIQIQCKYTTLHKMTFEFNSVIHEPIVIKSLLPLI